MCSEFIHSGERARQPVSRVLCPSTLESDEGDGHSSGPPIAGRFSRHTRAARTGDGPALARERRRAAPIWSCSRRGLPCRPGCPVRGGLLPHPFTLALSRGFGRFAFCGAVPGIAPGGRYPPPCRRGARTFLDPFAGAATARPSGPERRVGPPGPKVKRRIGAFGRNEERRLGELGTERRGNLSRCKFPSALGLAKLVKAVSGPEGSCGRRRWSRRQGRPLSSWLN